MNYPMPANKNRIVNWTLCLVALLVFILPLSRADAEHSVGGTGDPLRLLVAEARDDASIILIRVKPEMLEGSATVKAWYTSNYNEFVQSMQTATLEWTVAEEPTCAYAYTETHRILFSYATCKRALESRDGDDLENQRIRNKVMAVKLLLHENTHLLANFDEQLADQIALAIYRTWLTLDLNQTPRWDDLRPDSRPSDRSSHASAKIESPTFTGVFVWGGCNETPPEGETPRGIPCSTFLGDGGIYNKETESWEPVSEIPLSLLQDSLEGKRAFATAVHAPSLDPTLKGDVYVFGGCSGDRSSCSTAYNSMLVYSLDLKTWSIYPAPNGPSARSKHFSAWTGKSILIWGGVTDPLHEGRGISLNDGWIFDVQTKQWSSLNNFQAPSPRRFSSVVYTGSGNRNSFADSKLIVFGGCDKELGEQCPTYMNNGAVYDLNQNVGWVALPAVSLAPRAKAAAVWTGDSMVVLGGRNGTRAFADGAVLSFNDGTSNLSWKILSDLSDSPRYSQSAVWTGDRVVVWGGLSGYNTYVSNLSEFYLPTTTRPRGVWRKLELASSPVSRTENSAHWLKDGVFIWGGLSEDRAYMQSGGILRPRSNE
jgi:Galactose oxidase, central domain